MEGWGVGESGGGAGWGGGEGTRKLLREREEEGKKTGKCQKFAQLCSRQEGSPVLDVIRHIGFTQKKKNAKKMYF